MNKTLVSAVALTIFVSSQAFAVSGTLLTKLIANDPANPYCVEFLTQNDSVKYGTSLRDPGAAEALIILNNARGGIPAPTFIIGDPGQPFNAVDCSNGVTYVHSISR